MAIGANPTGDFELVTTHYSRKKIYTGDGLFTMKLRCPMQIEAGGTIRFSIFFLHQRDGAINPQSLSCKVYEGVQMGTLKATLTAYQDIYGTGSFFADYAVPPNEGTGPMYTVWSATYQSQGTASAMPLQATQIFRVVNPSGRVE